jgi:hypothetical protein
MFKDQGLITIDQITQYRAVKKQIRNGLYRLYQYHYRRYP